MIFLSHNHSDKPIVRQVAQVLENVYGRENVFYDEWSIQPGDSIIENMNRGLENCRFFFFFISENSLKSNMVKLEWQAALMKQNTQIKFIPVRLDNAVIPAILAPTLYIDLFMQGLEVATRQMIDVINGKNTFKRINNFSNLIAEISTEKDVLIVNILAEYYLEPHSRYLIVVDNEENDLSWSLPDFSEYTSGFNKNLSFSNGIHNCILVEVDSPTSPRFPVRIVLKPQKPKLIKILTVMHATSRQDFEPIPIRWH